MSQDEVFLWGMTIVCVTIVWLRGMKLRYQHREKRQAERGLGPEEDEMLKRLWDSAQRMEERITNLETILMHRTHEEAFRDRL